VVKITKRVVEAADAREKDYLIWDDELPGFGLRVFSSNKRSYVIQYRTKGRSRRYTIGLHGAWAPETARREAKVQLGRVAGGDDPVEDRQLDHKAITVKELCTRNLADLRAGLILGKGGRPKKASTITTDTGRIERHIILLLGTRRVKDLTKTDINKVLKDIMAGKTRVSVKTKKLRGRPSFEAALARPRVPLVFSAASLPTPSKRVSSRATRPMASASRRTMCESAGYRRRSIEYSVGCSATPPSRRNTLR
jgi:hypothetical protein